MSVRASLAAVIVAAGSLFVTGCAQTAVPTSPSSAGGASVHAQSVTVNPLLAQLAVVDNFLVSANHQLTLFFSPPNPVAPPDPVTPPDPVSPPWDQNTLAFYLKANSLLDTIPPNPIAPVVDALDVIIGDANITLDLIAAIPPDPVIPPNPIIPQIVTQANHTIAKANSLKSCGTDVCGG